MLDVTLNFGVVFFLQKDDVLALMVASHSLKTLLYPAFIAKVRIWPKERWPLLSHDLQRHIRAACVESRSCWPPCAVSICVHAPLHRSVVLAHRITSLRIVTAGFSLASVTLPSSLTRLDFFGTSFNEVVSADNLPSSLQTLLLGHGFNQPLCSLPRNLTSLRCGDAFNNFISPEALPESLTYLAFGMNFQHSLPPRVLPKQLAYLDLGGKFDHILWPGVLPESLTHLRFSDAFNQDIWPGTFPNSLTSIEFGCFFNKRLSMTNLPSAITSLVLPWSYPFTALLSAYALDVRRPSPPISFP